MLFGIMMSAALAVECMEPIPIETLEETLSAADAAYLSFDDDGFRDLINIAAGVHLPCVGDALPPSTVAHYHRVMSLHLNAIGDEQNAFLSLHAAKNVEPEAELDPKLFPDQHPLRLYWESIEADTSTRKVPEPRYGSVAFDGEHTRARPKEQPSIAQIFDEQGQAQSTQYLAPREPLPYYPAIPRKRNTLIGCGVGSVIGSGVTLGLAWSTRGRLTRDAQDLSVGADSLDSTRASMNAMSVASAALFGVATGCGAGAVVIGER